MKIYIQSNRIQEIAAKVSSETFNSFGLSSKIIFVEDFKQITKYFGSTYIRKGKKVIFKDDLQSFTLLRFLIPQLSKSKAPIMIIDPDIFAIKNPVSILNEVKDDQKLYCTFVNNLPRTEMMVLNPENKFWNFEKLLKDLFDLKIDYDDLFKLKFLNHDSLGKLNNKYNSLDQINKETVLLHTTNRNTQPWKEGLKIDFEIHASKFNIITNYLKKTIGLKYNEDIIAKYYKQHPDEEVVNYLVTIFNKAYQNNVFSRDEILNSSKNKYISNDFIRKLDFSN
tara:strand:- start:482 stop:1324 length:843 start_codon:yes stop_codon:yes gene_type:complete